MSTENETTLEEGLAELESVMREAAMAALVSGLSKVMERPKAEEHAARLLDSLEAEAARKALADKRAELETRFKPEARAMDRFVDGWLSAAEYLTKEPGL